MPVAQRRRAWAVTLPRGLSSRTSWAHLKSVFDELTSQPWFEASEEARESFAKYLFETFPAVTFDPVKHRSIIEASARMFYTPDSA